MKVKQLDHLNMSVKNLDESLDWYGRVFGFEKVEEGVRNGVRWAIAKSGEAMLCLYELPDCEYVDADALAKRGIHRMNHFAFRISDREAWQEVVRREGLKINYGGIVDWPHSQAWYVNDPTGYEIEVALWEGERIAFDPLSAHA